MNQTSMKTPLLKRRSTWIAVAILVLLALVLGIKQKRAAAIPPPPLANKVQTLEFLPSDLAQARAVDLRQTLSVTGALRAVNQAQVKARVAGEVEQVLVREGENVKANQMLVKMDVREYQARAEQARGAMRAAQGQLEIASKSRDNNRALLEKNFISKNAFENSESQYAIARANLESARAALDVTQKALADTSIRAPIAGVVSSRTVQPGEKIAADNKLLEIVDLRSLELEAAVPAHEILNVSLGQEVELSVAGLEQTVIGKVVRINPATQAGSRSILAYVQVDNPDNKLKAGMFGEARLTLKKKAGVLAIPATAVRNDAGSNYVYVVENGQLTRKPVKLGLAGSSADAAMAAAVEVLEGLAPGAQVVRSNLGELKPGTPVRLAGQTARAADR
jgi:membrane fusion protein (multidrug efflux system)